MKDFFSKEQKELALKKSRWYLSNYYTETENALHIFASAGNLEELSKAMKEHQLVEYALLYQLTPEYKEVVKKRRK